MNPPCKARTTFGSMWPREEMHTGSLYIPAASQVKVLHAASDQDGWDGGYICEFKDELVCIETEALREL